MLSNRVQHTDLEDYSLLGSSKYSKQGGSGASLRSGALYDQGRLVLESYRDEINGLAAYPQLSTAPNGGVAGARGDIAESAADYLSSSLSQPTTQSTVFDALASTAAVTLHPVTLQHPQSTLRRPLSGGLGTPGSRGQYVSDLFMEPGYERSTKASAAAGRNLRGSTTLRARIGNTTLRRPGTRSSPIKARPVSASSSTSRSARFWDKGGQSKRALEQALVPHGARTVDVHSQVTAHNVTEVLDEMAGRLARSEQRTNALQIENASLRKQVRELTDALTDVTHQTNAATVSVKEDFRILTEDLTKAQEAIEERDRKIRHLETDLKFARERSRITGQTYQEEKEDEASIGWGVSSQGEGGATGLQRAGKLYKGNSSNLGSAKGPPSEIKSARLDHRRNKQSVSSPPATQNVDRQVGRGDKVLTRSNKGANILDDRHDLSAVNALLQTSKHKDPETEEMLRAIVMQLQALVEDREAEIERVSLALKARDNDCRKLEDQLKELNLLMYDHFSRERGARLAGMLASLRADQAALTGSALKESNTSR